MLVRISDFTIRLSFDKILAGYTFASLDLINLAVNFIVLTAKHHIRCCKWTNKLRSLTAIESILKQKEIIEKKIAFDLSKIDKHNKKMAENKGSFPLLTSITIKT